MSIEGGNFICYIHDFETSKISEWNTHCTSTNHTEEGSTRCIKCDKEIKFSNLPFHPFDAQGHKNIVLKCPACETKFSNVNVRYAD